MVRGLARPRRSFATNRSFPPLAQPLNSAVHDPPSSAVTQKGKAAMTIRSSLQRAMIAIAGALAVSTVTVGAAIAPAHAVATSMQAAANA
jgi:hypothetical protein